MREHVDKELVRLAKVADGSFAEVLDPTKVKPTPLPTADVVARAAAAVEYWNRRCDTAKALAMAAQQIQ